MTRFNRQEQVAILFLSGALLVGTGAAIVDHYRPDRLEDFHVVSGAVTPPAPAAPAALAAANETAAPERVSINRAGVAELERLPGIGAKMAQAIVARRQAHGPFASVDDLTAVKGIGPRTVERLRALITAD